MLFFPLAGSVGLDLTSVGGRDAPASRYERTVPQYPEYDRRGPAAAADPGADEEFLRRVRERAEAQRRSYRESRPRRQRAPKPDPTGTSRAPNHSP